MINEKKKDFVLVAALDWGIGHATRSVPLIKRLQEEGFEVILASAGSSKKFYEGYFPPLTIIEKPAYNIRYFKTLPLALSILLQLPKIALAIWREHNWLKKIIADYSIVASYSDNCYGLWNKKIRTTFITHQLMVKCPSYFKFAESILHRIILFFINKYDCCLIPDHEGHDNLSGDLSHQYPLPGNAQFAGPFSRFAGNKIDKNEELFDAVVFLSGPEPQRTLLENKCESAFMNSKGKNCIIRGIPGSEKSKTDSENLTWFCHLPDERLSAILTNAKTIICRSGYSTIMDLTALNLTALLIPTPGQTEQEYLAKYHSSTGKFKTVSQEQFEGGDF